MELFQVNEKQYGWIFAIIAIGIIGASQINTLVLRNHSSETIIRVALSIQCIIGIVLVGMVLLGWSELYSTIFLIFLFVGCQGFIFPNASALSLAAFGHTAGSASALMGAIQMGIGATASAMVSLLQNHTALPMAGVMAGCSVTAFFIFILGKRTIIKEPTLQAVEEEDVDMISGI
jgi:DHA1 family bicyclomycin/chloramphenicol resistance-like MFS transporter